MGAEESKAASSDQTEVEVYAKVLPQRCFLPGKC